MARETINRLRAVMKEKGVDAYLVPTADFHDSEYAGEYFRTRAYLSGFTGSAGTLLVMADQAGLWTDGRYFVQAGRQLEGSGIDLYKSGQPGVPTIFQFLEDHMPENGKLGVDGRTISRTYLQQLERAVRDRKAVVCTDLDLGGDIWEDRPPMSCQPAVPLDEVLYAGETVQEKLEKVRGAMKKRHAAVHLITSLDDIAWLFNIRGGDIPCNPVALAYAAVTRDKAILFIQEAAVLPETREFLENRGVEIRPYDDIYAYASSIEEGNVVLVEKNRINSRLYACISEDVKVVDGMNPATLFKAIKNETEQANIRKAHVKDAVAMVHFIYWLKKNVGVIPMTEMSASAYLDARRAEQEGFTDLSFDTIAGYQENGAIVHYKATPETDAQLRPEGLFLVDSGGQYLEGTTDITRTIALGPVTDEQKFHYTLVLKGAIRLASATFMEGCTGWNLDMLARGPLWEHQLDYNHGTGHGVGYYLNVHEGPNRIHWDGRRPSAVFQPGMLTSDEPGLYLEGKYGIRTENLLLCLPAGENEYGSFLHFDTVTVVPIDKEPIDRKLLTEEEISWLNAYHQRVYETVSPYLEDADEKAWLAQACEAI